MSEKKILETIKKVHEQGLTVYLTPAGEQILKNIDSKNVINL